MKRFFVLYMASAEDFKKVMDDMASAAQQQQQADMKEWEEWMKTAGGVVDMGAPLGKTKRVTPHGVTDTRNEIGGYSIIEAESHEEAAQKMQNNPHFKMIPGGWVEVMEIMPM